MDYVSRSTSRGVTGDSHQYSREEDDTPTGRLPTENAYSRSVYSNIIPIIRAYDFTRIRLLSNVRRRFRPYDSPFKRMPPLILSNRTRTSRIIRKGTRSTTTYPFAEPIEFSNLYPTVRAYESRRLTKYDVSHSTSQKTFAVSITRRHRLYACHLVRERSIFLRPSHPKRNRASAAPTT